MIEPNALVSDFIHVGSRVKIAFMPKQKEKDYIEGIVKEILTKTRTDDKGIEVSLTSGYIGRVRHIIDESTQEQIECRVFGRENENVEKNSTFSFDKKTCKKNSVLKMAVVNAVVSFLNSYGGYVYIGVADDGEVLGLENDYDLMDLGDNDKMERQIRGTLEKYLESYTDISDCIRVSFPNVSGHEICEIKVRPSPQPIFRKIVPCICCIDNKKIPRNFDDFYIRDGNAKKLLETHYAFLSHWKRRFAAMHTN